MLIRFVVLLVGAVMGVKGAEVSGTRVMEPKGGDEVAASVVVSFYFCCCVVEF